MTTKEKKGGDTPARKLKASAGAWWKTSVVEDTPAQQTKKETPLPKKSPQVASKPEGSSAIKSTEQLPKSNSPQPRANITSGQDAENAERPKRPQAKKRPFNKNRYKGKGKTPYSPYKKRVSAKRNLSTDRTGNVISLLVDDKRKKNPAIIRALIKNRLIRIENEQQTQVRPQPVRASFTEGVAFGSVVPLKARSENKPVRDNPPTQKHNKKVVETAETVEEVKVVEVAETGDVAENVLEEQVVSKLLINAEEPEECRLALLENGKLQSLHVSTVNSTQTKNNIYKARIVAVEPSLQAAFVDYGREKNGFLPFSEIHPEYYKENIESSKLKLVKSGQWKKLSITDVVEKGQEILIQVVKEEIGKKGANMTTYLSLPGRCVVLMPGSDSTGVSRKISGEGKRNELRDIMKNMGIPDGIGWIVRTASIDINENALSRDVEYLLRLWDETKRKGQELENIGLIYEDHHSVLRFLREHFDPSIEEILVDDRDALEEVKGFVELLPAKQRGVKVRLHKGNRPIFNQFSVEDQIESIYQPHVNLPSGGSIVINPTEALVAIDVNSGSTSKGKNFEASIFHANMEAAKELARQLRLRDLGGLIVVDFIDMRSRKNIRDVEREVKIAMKRDKAKVDFSRISKFGLMEISRQKLGAPLEAGNYRVCEHCKGRGTVKSVETLALFYLRRIQTGASRKNVEQVECHFPLDVAQYLLNKKRNEIGEIEKKYETEIQIYAEPHYKPAQNDIIFNKVEKEV